MSKKKTGAEMILDMLKQYMDGNWRHPTCKDENGDCEEDCDFWDEEEGCTYYHNYNETTIK